MSGKAQLGAVVLGFLGQSLVCPAARAATGVVAFAAPSAGQAGVATGFDRAGVLRAVSCATSGCEVDRGTEIPFPAELRAAIPNAQFSVVGIGGGRRAIVISVSDAHRGRSWSALLAGPLGAGEPTLIFSGFTGFTRGEEGTRRGQRLEISAPDEGGARRIVLGDVEEDLSLCGRPALLAPQLLASTDLKLHPAKMQRLTPDERERARPVTAVRVLGSAAKASAFGVIHAIAASSALGSPSALTDGNPETRWAENRGGAGRGEFVLINAPPELPISGLDVLIRPPQAKLEHGVAPREFWLASNHDLVQVTMPEDAWKFPGAHYTVKLEPPLRSDCLALVTESAFDESPNAQVTFAEVSAKTEFDDLSVPALVAAMAGGGERAQAAEAVLRVVGPVGFDAVAGAYDALDEGGRRVALDLMDQAPCQTSVPVYLKAFSGPNPAHAIHGRDHIRRCAQVAAPYLAAGAKQAQGTLQLALLGELRLADAARCVDVIVSLLDVDSRKRRQALRIELARASEVAAAKPRILAVLEDPATSERVQLEMLRALGSRIGSFQPAAGSALTRLSGPGASFRARFLVLEPRAVLAENDPALRASFALSLSTDPDPRYRAQALSALKTPALFEPSVQAALRDPDVRVREAAVRAAAALPDAAPALSERLGHDPWPLVRMAAADALSAAPPTAATESALTRAIEDPSPHVRAHVLTALGAHQVHARTAEIRARLADEDEYPMVRAAAALALAALCDQQSLATLTDYAQKLAYPMAEPAEHVIGAAALLALGDLRPADLRARLKPLLAKTAPAQAAQAADAVLHRPAGACSGTGARPSAPADRSRAADAAPR